jgi:hypothetical protein
VEQLMGIDFTARFAAGAILVCCVQPANAQTVTVVVDGTLAAPARHGLGKMEDALRAKGLTVTESAGAPAGSALVVLAGVRSADGAATAAVSAVNGPLPEGSEALTIRRSAPYAGRRAVVLLGSDPVGLMYAALDTAERIGWSTSRTNPFDRVKDVSEKPATQERGVQTFYGNKAYFESKFYDERYWIRYFDLLAADRFNNFLFCAAYETQGFLAPIYPYFFDVPGYPNVHMMGITPELQAKNTATLKHIIQLAHDRGIGFTLGCWNHIGEREDPPTADGAAGRGGRRGAAGGGRAVGAADGAAAAGAAAGGRSGRAGGRGGGLPFSPLGGSSGSSFIPGVVPGVTGLGTANLIPYTKAALTKLYQTFPEVDKIQFRMHGEAAIPTEEMPTFWHEIFSVVAKFGKPADLRAKGVDKSIYYDAIAQGTKLTVNTKFWMEQVGLPFHPTHVNVQNQHDVRHQFADLLEYPRKWDMTWQVWTSGTNRLLLWGDPDYVKRLVRAAHIYGPANIDIYEFGATKMFGAANDAEPIPVLTGPYRTYDYEFERYWAFYRAWGRLEYNPDTDPETWSHEYLKRFGDAAGPHVMKSLQLASRVLPHIVAASYLYSGFPTTGGAGPENGAQGSLPIYAAREEGSDIQQFENVRDAAKRILEGGVTSMRTPQEMSYWFAQTSAGILRELAAAQTTASPQSREFQATAADLRILAGLARYHSARLLGGVAYNLYLMAGDLVAFDEAIGHEKDAIQAWSDMVTAAGDVYSPESIFIPLGRPWPTHWKQVLGWLNDAYVQLLDERKTATGKPDSKHVAVPVFDPRVRFPTASLPVSAPAEVGSPIPITAKVAAVNGVRWVRLRYRHLNQKEDYETAEMQLDPKTGLYSASIPAAFIDPKWDLQYFVEVIDRTGSGRQFPDLDVEMPYVVLSVKR